MWTGSMTVSGTIMTVVEISRGMMITTTETGKRSYMVECDFGIHYGDGDLVSP